MNFSLNDGNPIAFYKDEDGETKIIHTKDSNNYNNENKKLTLEEITDIIEDFIRSVKGRVSMKQIDELQKALKNDERPKDEKIAKIYDNLKNTKSHKHLHIPNGGVSPIFDPNEERKIFYICGMSGCGKSTFVSQMISNYHKIFPKNKVLFFSNKPKDPAIDKHKYVVRIKINDELVDDPLDLEELKNSLVIYDDIEYIPSKAIANELDRVRDLILQQGRSYHISFCYVSHLLNNYKQSRVILNECHCCVLFPQMTTTYSLKYLLEKYFGFGKDDLLKLKSLPSRWVCINKIPPCVIHDKGCYMID